AAAASPSTSPAATTAAATPGPTSGPISAPTSTPPVTPGPTIGPGATVPPFAPGNAGLLWDALRLTQEHFVRRGQLDPNRLTYGAISGLIGALGDPGHTAFLTPDQAQSETEALDGTIVGIGIFLALESGTPVIVSVIDRSPADRAGLRSGDALVGINGASAAALTVAEIAARIRGAEGTTVTLTVIHRGTDVPVDITIRRERIVVPAVTWAMVPGTTIADLRVTQFSAGAEEEFHQALRAARQAGASALVVDLRSNPGGYVGEAVEIVSSLVEKGTVYVRRTADGKEIPVPVKGSALAPDLPLVVLIDYGSASSAEITAGALQDTGRGRLVGIRTFGTGTVLNTFSLPDGSALRLAVEEWLTPNRSFIFPTGITPDERVELDPDAVPLDPIDLRDLTPAGLRASGDTQLLRAIDLLRGG
ncbi:MAG: S41 family peptidase, partial [Chloroflexi bacterium]|nr:S41 family peptidase [Chloroflexota bacterium]